MNLKKRGRRGKGRKNKEWRLDEVRESDIL